MAACVAAAISPPSNAASFEDFLDATTLADDGLMLHASAASRDENSTFLSPLVAALSLAPHAKAFQTCRFGYREVPVDIITSPLPSDSEAAADHASGVGNWRTILENHVNKTAFELDSTVSVTRTRISETESEGVSADDVNVSRISKSEETLTEVLDDSQTSVTEIKKQGTIQASVVSADTVVGEEEDSKSVSGMIAEKQEANTESDIIIQTDNLVCEGAEAVLVVSLHENTSKCGGAEAATEESDSAAFLVSTDQSAHAIQAKSEVPSDYEEGIIETECMTAVEATDSGVPRRAPEEDDIVNERELILATSEVESESTENESRVATVGEVEDQTTGGISRIDVVPTVKSEPDLVTGTPLLQVAHDVEGEEAKAAISSTAIVYDSTWESVSNARKPFSFTGLNHVAFCVESLERSLNFYCGLLGLKTNLDRPDLPYRGAWLYVGAEGIHIMEVPNPDPIKGRPSHGGFDRHACLNCSNVEAIRMTLEKEGIPYQPSMVPSIFTRDPDGNGLEFIEISS